ncbi:KTSC domain-containing protein [Oceanobacillus jeddahense]
MNMIPVSSSDLQAVGYDSLTRRLVIQFTERTYEYSDVPESIYKGLMNSSSKGKYHHEYIKNSYPNLRIG